MSVSGTNALEEVADSAPLLAPLQHRRPTGLLDQQSSPETGELALANDDGTIDFTKWQSLLANFLQLALREQQNVKKFKHELFDRVTELLVDFSAWPPLDKKFYMRCITNTPTTCNQCNGKLVQCDDA